MSKHTCVIYMFWLVPCVIFLTYTRAHYVLAIYHQCICLDSSTVHFVYTLQTFESYLHIDGNMSIYRNAQTLKALPAASFPNTSKSLIAMHVPFRQCSPRIRSSRTTRRRGYAGPVAENAFRGLSANARSVILWGSTMLLLSAKYPCH